MKLNTAQKAMAGDIAAPPQRKARISGATVVLLVGYESE